MNIQLFTAGILSLCGAAIHGGVGDAIVRRIDQAGLPSSIFGEGTVTHLFIRVTWHIVTASFIAVGIALIISGLDPEVEATTGIAILSGALFTLYTLVAAVLTLGRFGLRGFTSRRALLRHPGPAIFIITTVLIWWGLATL